MKLVVDPVVANWTMDREVVGVLAIGRWTFFFSSLSYQKCVHNQVPRGGATHTVFLESALLFGCTKFFVTI